MARAVLLERLMINSARTPQSTDIPFLCEYSREPLDDCYCRKLSSRTVPNIALYCMDRFRECPIYRKQTQTVNQEKIDE